MTVKSESEANLPCQRMFCCRGKGGMMVAHCNHKNVPLKNCPGDCQECLAKPIAGNQLDCPYSAMRLAARKEIINNGGGGAK